MKTGRLVDFIKETENSLILYEEEMTCVDE